jgi:hypothetical protein
MVALINANAAGAFPEKIPTSQLLEAALYNAPGDHLTTAWLFNSLHHRSFGMALLLLGLIAILPGLSVLAGILVAVLACQMIRAYEAPILPRFIARRRLPTRRLAWLLDRAIPLIKVLENFIRPRWQMPFVASKRIVGFTVLLLATTFFVPILFSNVIPGVVTVLIAFAYLEEDGVLLCLALGTAFVSLAITFAEIWATVRGADLLFRL